MSSNLNNILYGKQGIEKIVSIEPKDSSVEVFFEEDCRIRSEVFPNEYWLMADKPLSFDNTWDRLDGNLFYKWIKTYASRDEFLQDRNRNRHKNLYSIYNPKEALMVHRGLSNFLNLKLEDVSIFSFDLETTGLDPQADDAFIVMIATTFRNKKGTVRKLFCYDEYDGQGELIEAFCHHIKTLNPTILLGHNILDFDFPYLDTIANLNDVSLDLGRDGSSIEFDNYEKKFRVDGNRDLHYHDVKCYGREIVDTMQLAIKADIGRKYNSYGLKKIVEQEGWEIPGRVFYDASKIRENYKNKEELKKIKAYAEFDADDAITLYDKFVPPFFYFSMSVPKSFQQVIQSASGSQINAMMIRSYLQDGHSLPKADEPFNFEGAISEGYPGIYSNILKLDVNSLYPSLMLEYEISPKHKDPKNYCLQLLKYYRENRLKNKKLAAETGEQFYVHMEQSEKIFANSVYGFLGAPGLLFNNIIQASLVTRKGRETLTQAMEWVKNQPDLHLANVDTDSISFGFKDGRPMSPEQKDKFISEVNAMFPASISWADDGLFEKFIVIKAKNYVMYDPTHKNPKKRLTYKGSALKSPTLEPALREFIQEIVNLILNDKTNYTAVYHKYAFEILNLKDIKRWAGRKTITNKTLESERTNESKIRDAIEQTEYVEGDRVYVYFKSDDSLGLIEEFDGDYNIDRLLEKLHKTAKRFETILDVKTLFTNYKLKKNKEKLKDINYTQVFDVELKAGGKCF